MNREIKQSKPLLFNSFLIIYIMIALIVNIFELSKTIFNNSYNIYIIIFLTIFSIANIILSKELNNNFINFILFGIYVLISFLITNNFINDYARAFILVFWCVPFMISYSMLKDDVTMYKIFNIYGITSIIMCCIYIYGTFSGIHTVQSINAAYYTLFTLPYIPFIKNKYLRTLSIVLLTFSVLISGKSTIIIAYGMIIISYIFLNKKLTFKSLLFIILGIFVFYMLYKLSINIFESDFFAEVIDSVENGGNGRTLIYQTLLEHFSNASISKKLFGYGCYGAERLVNISAHNDFLEVLIDYGLLGIALYINIYVTLIRELKRIDDKKIHQSMIFSIILFFFVSMGSNIIFVPTYFIFMTFFWGMIFKYNILKKNEGEHNDKNSNIVNG